MAAHPLPGQRLRRRCPRRLAARFVTGPGGHLVAGMADWLLFLARVLYARARGRRLG